MAHIPEDSPDMVPQLTLSQDAAEAKQNIFPVIEQKIDTDYIPITSDVGISVTDPEKKGDGVTAYVTYKVNVKVKLDQGKVGETTVIRRYSDFAFLHDLLVVKYPGWLIPPLPEKAIMGRFTQIFIESRRRALELFLVRISRHKELSKSEDVHLFLFREQEFADLKEGKSKPKNKAKGFVDYISEISATITTIGSGKDHERSQEDVVCEGVGKYIETLETQVGSMTKNVGVISQITNDTSRSWYDFGFACTVVGQFEKENEEQHLSNAFSKMGTCADQLSVFMGQTVDKYIIYIQEPLEDFIRVLGAVKVMLRSRAAAEIHHQNVVVQLEAKQATLSKYQGKQGKEDKIHTAEAEVAEAQRKVDEALQKLQEITYNVFEEITRFRKEKRANFQRLMIEFTREQIEHCKKVQQSWEAILPDIDAIPSDGAPT